MYEDYTKGIDNGLYEVPLFDGKSRITALTWLPAKHFDIWVEVSAACGEGALISASGTKDHLWLGFVDDEVVLRFDAGSGPLELHAGKVKIDGRSKLSARRYKRDAVVKLNSVTAKGTAKGKMTSLDVGPFIYVGQPPDNVTKLSGTSGTPGFIGCVHRLRVSGRDVIPPARNLIVSSSGVRSCTPDNLARLVCP